MMTMYYYAVPLNFKPRISVVFFFFPLYYFYELFRGDITFTLQMG